MALTKSDNKLEKGDRAPAFELSGTDGKTHSLESLAPKEGLLVVFMCNHCPYVQAKTEELVSLHKEFGERIGFAGINSNDPEYPGEGMENMKEFARERGIAFPYLFDETQETARAYGAVCTPDPFLFDKNLQLVFHGRITDAMEPADPVSERTMRIVTERLLKGEDIDPWFNPSLGCSIKWRE